jgi:hypothetical protein
LLKVAVFQFQLLQYAESLCVTVPAQDDLPERSTVQFALK